MSGTEYAKEKENVAAIMRAKQAAGKSYGSLLSTQHTNANAAEAKKNEQKK